LTEEQRQFLATFDDDRYPNDPNADLSAIISTMPPEARAFLSDLRKFLDEGGGDALKGISALGPITVLGSGYGGLGSTGSNDAGNAGTSVAAVSGAKLGGLGSTSSTHDLNDCGIGRTDVEKVLDWYLNESPNAKFVDGAIGRGRAVIGDAVDAADSVVDSAQAFGSWYVDRYTAIGSNVSAMAGAGYDAAGDAVHAFGETVGDSVSFVGDSVSGVGDAISDVGGALKGIFGQ
jgi:hypothetical protein